MKRKTCNPHESQSGFGPDVMCHHPAMGGGPGGPGGPGPWDMPGGPGGPGGGGRGRGRRHGGPMPVYGPFGPRGRGRAARGQLRAAVLLLLAEQPRHGYDLITELTDRSDGRWSPSPGAVYPVLRRLADKGLVTVEVVDGRKTFRLTDDGVAYVEEHRESWGEPWEAGATAETEADRIGEAIRSLVMAAGQVMEVGTPEQQQRAEELLAATRKQLFAMLAE